MVLRDVDELYYQKMSSCYAEGAVKAGCTELDKSLFPDRDISNALVEKTASGRIGTFVDSLRVLFGSTQKRDRTESDEAYYSAKSSITSSLSSSSSNLEAFSDARNVEDSWSFEDSYIKVPKFTDEQENGKEGHFGTLKEFRECQMQQNLADQIKDVVETNTSHRIRMSDHLTLSTAADIMNLARSEPYGLKGCKVILVVEDQDEKLHLGNLYPETGIISTFEVTLVLHLRKLKIPLLGRVCRPKSMEVAEQYELRKEKLYMSKSRRNSPGFIS